MVNRECCSVSKNSETMNSVRSWSMSLELEYRLLAVVQIPGRGINPTVENEADGKFAGRASFSWALESVRSIKYWAVSVNERSISFCNSKKAFYKNKFIRKYKLTISQNSIKESSSNIHFSL